MNLYWLGGSNFGDRLTPLLYRLITGKEPTLGTAPPRIFCIGSIATIAQEGDTLWGTGVLSPYLHIDPELYILPGEKVRLKARALAVRGPLTDALLDTPCNVYGDPSLLLPEFYSIAVGVKASPVIVPHYVDKPIVTSDKFIVVDIQSDPLSIINQLASAEWVASSTLHGLSVAEAYGAPAVWVEFSDNVAGRGFKFRDYYLGTGREPPEPVDCREGWSLPAVEKQLASWTPPIIRPELLTTCPFLEER